jgi:hypothetical protein
MKKIGLFVVTIACLLGGQAQATLAVRLKAEEIFSAAERVVAVRCLGEVRTFTSADGKRIFTEFAFEVEEEFRGSGPRTFSIVQPGGRFGRVAQKAWGYPTFSAGEQLVLFLSSTPSGPQVVGLSQGVFVWQDGQKQRLRQRIEGLELIDGPAAGMSISREELQKGLRLFPFRPGQVRP